jgi:NAD-dependent deacetylase
LSQRRSGSILEKMNNFEQQIEGASRLLRGARHLVAFTGAGISVESGIPPFRGEGGLWSIYDPTHFEISYFVAHPKECWATLKKIFYERFETASPNEAHRVLARFEEHGLLKAVITQNIDNLHRRAGSGNVIEYHGSSRELLCLGCGQRCDVTATILKKEDMRCRCGGLLKPDFVFFGEEIPRRALLGVQAATTEADVMLVVGTTGEIYPAAQIPIEAKWAGARIVEVNVEPSSYTSEITDIFLQGSAANILQKLEKKITLQGQ